MHEKAIVLSDRDDLVHAVERYFVDRPREALVVLRGVDAIQTVDEEVSKRRPSLLLVDESLGASERDLSAIGTLGLGAIAERFRTGEGATPAMRALKAVQALRGKGDPNLAPLIVVFVAANPSVALTQAALRHGADWVWPDRMLTAAELPVVVDKLRALLGRDSPKPRRRLFVVENSSNDFQDILNAAGDDWDVTSAGDDLPLRDLADLDAGEALATYLATGPYSAVVVDLALRRRAEEEAASLPMSMAGIEDRLNAGQRELFAEVFEGLRIVSEIRERTPTVTVVVMSTWLDAVKVDFLNFCFAKIVRDVELIQKGSSGYRELRELLSKCQ